VGRAKDKDYVQKLTTYSAGRLLDMVRVAERRAKGGVAWATIRGRSDIGHRSLRIRPNGS